MNGAAAVLNALAGLGGSNSRIDPRAAVPGVAAVALTHRAHGASLGFWRTLSAGAPCGEETWRVVAQGAMAEVRLLWARTMHAVLIHLRS